MGTVWLWLGFNALVLGLLALDLGVFHRKAHAIGVKEAAGWSAFWVALALLFNAGLWLWAGPGPALQFLTGYLVEKSLSVDNIFVMVLIFGYLAVPAVQQHRVLFWGIVGALVMRGGMIAAGAYVLERWHWVIYVFGALLVVTGVKLALRREQVDIASNPVVRFARRFLPLTPRYDGARFWTIEHGRRVATPLFLALLLVEFTDLVFAVDSIPAIFAITSDPFLVYTSNVFAILGMRSLYFLLAGVADRFVYLKYGLAAILVFVGLKMLLVGVFKVPALVSLGVIALLLAGSMALSLRSGRRVPAPAGKEAPAGAA